MQTENWVFRLDYFNKIHRLRGLWTTENWSLDLTFEAQSQDHGTSGVGAL